MFNVRVYGIVIGENKQVLVSDEYIRGEYVTKFPGGGLDFGEGTRDCLKREFKEEMDLAVQLGDHLYTTDSFQLEHFFPASAYLHLLLRICVWNLLKFHSAKNHSTSTNNNWPCIRKTQKTETFRASSTGMSFQQPPLPGLSIR